MGDPQRKESIEFDRSSLLLVIPLGLVGSLFIFLSIQFDSLLLGLIGLGFFFFASLSYLIAPRWFFRGELVTSLVNSNLSVLRRLLVVGGYSGKGIYVPSKEGEVVIFIPKEETLLYLPEIESAGKTLFLRSPEGIVLGAPGTNILETVEELLGISFEGVELHYALSMLSTAYTELEISRTFEFIVEGERIVVRMEDVVGKGFCKELRLKFPEICERIGCPFCSAIACLISKSMGKSVIIDSVDLSPDGKVTQTTFRVIR